jgi:hypothetical protein
MAQDRDSFELISGLTGLTSNLTGTNLLTTLDAGSTFVYQSQTYTITDVFAIFLLDDDDDLFATGVDQSGWRYHENYSTWGGITGWHANPNSALTPGNQISLDYSTLTGVPESFGYHVRVSTLLPNNENTIYVVGSAVPEPSAVAVVLLGLAALRRRRRT